MWRSCVVAVLSIVVLGCSDGDGEPQVVSSEIADDACRDAAAALEEFTAGRDLLDEQRLSDGIAAAEEVGRGVAAPELVALSDATAAAMAAAADLAGDLDADGFAASLLELRRSSAALGLWCLEHASAEVSADLARDFLRAS